MGKRRLTQRLAGTGEPTKSRIYEVREFVRLKARDDLVPVRHFRTSYHPDGRISQEVLSTGTSLEQMIRAFDGYVFKSAETVTGVFDDPDDARECARVIALYHDKKVELITLYGSVALDISVPSSLFHSGPSPTTNGHALHGLGP